MARLGIRSSHRKGDPGPENPGTDLSGPSVQGSRACRHERCESDIRPKLRSRQMSTVRAAVMERPGRIAVQEFPMPEPGQGAVLMQVSYSGICGTDKHTFRGESKQYAGTAHERDLTYPLICGHENVGRVAALGGTVRDSDGSPLK